MKKQKHKSKSKPPQPAATVLAQPSRFVARIRNYFLTGVVVVAPVSLTIYFSWLFIGWVDEAIVPLLPRKYDPETYLPFSVPGFGLLVVFLFLTFVGFMTANFFGRRMVLIGENLLSKMPVVRSIYSGLKQIFETLLQQSSQSFRQAVLIEYPRRGVWAIAFVTGDTEGEFLQKINNDDLLNIYVPTTPNPTSGFMLVVPRKDLIFLDMAVEDALKVMISMGVISTENSSSGRNGKIDKIGGNRKSGNGAAGK